MKTEGAPLAARTVRGQVENRETTSTPSRPESISTDSICQSHVEIEPAAGGAILLLGGRTVGQVIDGVLRKSVLRSRHLLRSRNAYVWDLAVLRVAVDLGATSVQVTDSEAGNVYRATMADLRAKGFPVSLGCGEQWGLALPDFELLTGQPNPFESDEAAPRQLSLLGAQDVAGLRYFGLQYASGAVGTLTACVGGLPTQAPYPAAFVGG